MEVAGIDISSCCAPFSSLQECDTHNLSEEFHQECETYDLSEEFHEVKMKSDWQKDTEVA